MGYLFDGPTQRITLTPGTTTLSVTELWSRWVDWLETGDNSKYGDALSQVGGDIAAIPIYVFLADTNGQDWKIVPQSANHVLEVVDGVLYTRSGSDPFVDPVGNYKIRINRQTPGIAIGYSSTGSDPAAVAAAVWGHGTALNAVATLVECWGRLGLDADAPLITGQTEISFGNIVMALTEVAGQITVTRQ